MSSEVFLSARKTARSFSTITTRRAPREAASKPSAPLPAKRSRQVFPLKSCPSQLNSVSRTRSGVGRKSLTEGKAITRLRQVPPTIRTRFRAAERATATSAPAGAGNFAGIRSDHDGRHAIRIDAAPERVPNLRDRDALHVRNEFIEIRQRQTIEADDREIFLNLAIAIDAQREPADDILFRCLQLGLRRPVRHEIEIG